MHVLLLLSKGPIVSSWIILGLSFHAWDASGDSLPFLPRGDWVKVWDEGDFLFLRFPETFPVPGALIVGVAEISVKGHATGQVVSCLPDRANATCCVLGSHVIGARIP